MKQVSRRQVVGGAALAAVATTAGAQASLAAEAGQAWDDEADLVVVGGGTGLFGALLGAHEGADVLLLEKTDDYGGTTFYSGGVIWCPNNHTMKPNGFDDSREAALTYIKACDLRGRADESKIESMVDRMPSVVRYINEQLEIPLVNLGSSDYYNYEGHALGRSVMIGDGSGYGYENWCNIMDPLVEASGLRVSLNTQATELIQDETGAVVGVLALREGETLRVHARAGVVLACGGFDHNQAMVDAYLPFHCMGTLAHRGCTGDGHAMGVAVGADLDHMWSAYGGPCFIAQDDGLVSNALDETDYRLFPNSVIVDRFGKRFVNEGCSYDMFARSFGNVLYHSSDPTSPLPAWLIFDSRYVQDYGFPQEHGAPKNDEMPEWVHEYQSLEELAEAEGIDAEGLLAQVERFNGFCDSGVDEDFHRGESGYETPETGIAWMQLVVRDDLANPEMGPVSTAPFYCAKIGPATYNTSGGLKVDQDCRVLAGGEPVAGLYAAGCNAGSFVPAYFAGGTGVGQGVYMACIAVDAALKTGLF